MEVLPNNSCCPTFGPNWVTWPSLAVREADQEIQFFSLMVKDVGGGGVTVNVFRKTASVDSASLPWTLHTGMLGQLYNCF